MEKAPPQILVLGSPSCGKSTLLHSLAYGACPSRKQLRQTDGCNTQIVLCRDEGVERVLEGSGTGEERHIHEIALVEPVATDRSSARFVYYEEAHAVWICYEAGSAGSWRAGLLCLAEYMSHKLKRRLQHDHWKVAHGRAEAARTRRQELAQAVERIKRDMLDMSILFIAMRSGSGSTSDLTSSRGSSVSTGMGKQGGQDAAGTRAASLPEWLETALACGAAGCRGQRPRAGPLGDMPGNVSVGSVYPHAKVRIPLLLPNGYMPDWWGQEEAYRDDDREELCCSFARSCWRRQCSRAARLIPSSTSPLCTACCWEATGPTYLSLEVPVLALQCSNEAGGLAEASSCWLADCGPDGTLSVPCPLGMEGSEGALPALVDSMRQALQAWVWTEQGRGQAVFTRQATSGGARSGDRGSGYV